MGLNLIMIDTDESLSRYWPKVKQGIEVVLSKCKVHWIPEDVYSAIKSKQSVLIIGERNGVYEGFIVMTIEQVYDGNQLRIWLAYNKGAHRNLIEAWANIKGICENLGCRRIVMSSPRKGWGRLSHMFMMEPALIEYEYELR